MRAAIRLAFLVLILPLPAAISAAEPDAIAVATVPALLADAADDSAKTSATESVAAPVQSLGSPVPLAGLEAQRGGAETVNNDVQVTGEVADNTARNVVTGANSIQEGSFANASGITTVVQNTGANVLIQSATTVSVLFREP